MSESASAVVAANSGGDNGETSLTVRIRALRPGLACAVQRVATVVLEDPFDVARRSISEVARAAQTSETTVTRFCQTIGVSGYPALRIALATETAHAPTTPSAEGTGEIDSADEVTTLVRDLSYADARAVEDTVEQLGAAKLAEVIDTLARAGRVNIYGVGGSAVLAADLQQKLHRIGMVSFACSDAHRMLSSACLLGAGDVALGLSHSGTTIDTVNALRTASDHGATTVALTTVPQAPISEVAEQVLTTAGRETTFRSGDTASLIPAMTVVDCLFVGLAQHDRTAAVSTLEAARDATSTHRLPTRPDGRRRSEPTRRHT